MIVSITLPIQAIACCKAKYNRGDLVTCKAIIPFNKKFKHRCHCKEWKCPFKIKSSHSKLITIFTFNFSYVMYYNEVLQLRQQLLLAR